MYNALTTLAQFLDSGAIGVRKHSADNVFAGVLTTVYTITGMVAVIVIIIAGYIFATSNGNAAKAQKARQAILYAVIGIIVVLMAFAITQYVIGNV